MIFPAVQPATIGLTGPSKERMMKHLPLTFVGVHTALVLIMAAVVGLLGGEAVMLWNFFMFADFPLSFVFSILFEPILNWAHVHLSQKWIFTVVYAAYFGLAGGIQYYCFGWFLSYSAAKRK